MDTISCLEETILHLTSSSHKPLQLMVRGVQDTPKTTKAIAIAFDCLLEIEGELGEPIIEDNTYFEHMT